MVGHQETKKFLCRHINWGFNFKWSAFKRAGTTHRASLEIKKKKKKSAHTKNPNPFVRSFLFLGKQCAALKLIALHSNIWCLIILSSKSPIPCRIIVLYALVIKTLLTKINMYFTVIKQELILYFFTSGHLLWHWMVMHSRERSTCFNPRKIRLEN